MRWNYSANMELKDILKQTVDNLKQVTDSESVVGKPIISTDGTVILPVVKLSAGYVVGSGGDKADEDVGHVKNISAGVGGGGVSVIPVGFLLCGKEKRFISVDKTTDSKWIELLKTAVQTVKGDDYNE